MAKFYRVSGSLAAMSFCGAMFVIFSYLSMPVLRKHPTNMVFFLSVSDLLFSLKFIITALTPKSAELECPYRWTCYMQAGWAQFWGTASISWIGMISLNLIIELHKQGFARTASYSKYYHMFVWSLSGFTTCVMFIFSTHIGPSGDGTCWIHKNDDALRLLFFVPLIIYFLISIITVGLAFVRTSNGVMSDASRRAVMIRMVSYVAVFLVCWSLPLVHRIYLWNSETSENPLHPTTLQMLDAVGVSIQGFANAMVWLSNPSFFIAIKKHVIDKYFGCLFSDDREKHPLLTEIQGNLTDVRQDITIIGQILRRNIVTCILLGIQQSMRDLRRSDVTQKSYADKRTYNYDELRANDEITEGQAQAFQFVDYSPLVFAHIRELSSVSMESYKESMNVNQFLGKIANDQLAKFSDGRSDSFFIFSPDKKFILKTISSKEAAVLLKMLPSLHHYFRANPHSLITRFYGCHAVRVSHGDLLHVVVMGNVFSSSMAIHECYDLKGSWVNRSAGPRSDPSKLGMDNDFKRKLKLDPSIKAMFLDQAQKDALLLSSLNIMDYSLLLGIHFTDRDDPHHSQNGVELVRMPYIY
eukprot:Phypoly_transcript_03525.p1 GENE.Phypoly_transcript_03525~~Phypoly_transcript_03525.p1  ORF type:complete len:593 (+),score=54.51 Phypoly_transcript_03525:31-1779(+)